MYVLEAPSGVVEAPKKTSSEMLSHAGAYLCMKSDTFQSFKGLVSHEFQN